VNQLGKTIRIGHSPDADDAFMYFGFASGQVTIPGFELENILHDIQTLNELAEGDDPLEVTALSLHAYFSLEHRYELLQVGTSVGRNYGPRVVALKPMSVDELRGLRIALPGPRTTATLAARGLLPAFEERQYDFDAVIGAVQKGEVDAGVLIHEGQLTYAQYGLHLIADLGQMFSARHDGLPLPLGVNTVRRDLPEEVKRAVAEAYRASVNIALTQRIKALEYSLSFGRGLDRATTDRFVGMYVNEDSLHFSEDIQAAVEILRTEYWGKNVHSS
jgi:1,4-dihydroxy-6-naphthoate synthase